MNKKDMYTLVFLTYKLHYVKNVTFYQIADNFYMFKQYGNSKLRYIKKSEALLVGIKKQNN